MKIEESYAEGRFVWRLSGLPVGIDELCFSMPTGWRPDATHPDLQAAAALLALRPFLDGRLQVARPVSPGFAAAASAEFGLEIWPVRPDLEPRSVDGGRVGLAYSGGVDSTAALLVLPADTCCVFADRAPADDLQRARTTKYRPEAAHRAVRAVESAGWEAVCIGTNMEYLGDQVGFPVTDASSVESSGAPILLLADHLGLDGVAWGTILEVTYGVGFGGFRDHLLNTEHRRWRRLLSAAGMSVLLPLAGVSEVGARRIVDGSPLDQFAQSCVRGAAGQPCMNCVKCVRKTLIQAASTADWPSADEIDRLLLAPQFRTTLRRTPVPLTNVYRYALSRCPVSSELIDLLKLRFAAETPAAGYLERAYEPASEAWPYERRAALSGRLLDQLGMMTTDDVAQLESWDPADREGDPLVATFAELLADHLDAVAGEPCRASGLVPFERPFLDIERPEHPALRAAIARLGGPATSARRRAAVGALVRRQATRAKQRMRRLVRAVSSPSRGR